MPLNTVPPQKTPNRIECFKINLNKDTDIRAGWDASEVFMRRQFTQTTYTNWKDRRKDVRDSNGNQIKENELNRSLERKKKSHSKLSFYIATSIC